MLDKVKIALGIDTEDTYFDTYLEMLILASENYIKELIPTEITENMQARYNVCVLALVTYMFNNREMEVESSVNSNKVIKSLLSSLRYRGE